MAQVEIKRFLTGVMDLDSDPMYIKQGNYRRAYNIRASRDSSEGSLGNKENIRGNKMVFTALPLGTNKCVASISDTQTNYTYFMVWNSSSNHGIYRLDLKNEKVDVIYIDPCLDFTGNNFKNNIDIINGIIYWTDGEPKRIDVERARLHTVYNAGPARPGFASVATRSTTVQGSAGANFTTLDAGQRIYVNGQIRTIVNVIDFDTMIVDAPLDPFTNSSFYLWAYNEGYSPAFKYGSLDEKRKFILAIKAYSMHPPELSVSTDTSYSRNNIENKAFQFRQRFKFQNFEESVFSPYSKIIYSRLAIAQKKDIQTAGVTDNLIWVKFFVPHETVTHVDISARTSNISDDRLITTVDIRYPKDVYIKTGNAYYPVTGSLSYGDHYYYRFLNDGVYGSIDVNDSIQPYDDIPLIAESQEVVLGSRVIYGGPTSGFDNVDLVSNIEVESAPFEQPFSTLDMPISEGGTFLTVDFSSENPASANGGLIMSIVCVQGSTGQYFSFDLNRPVFESEDFVTALVSEINGQFIGGVTWYASQPSPGLLRLTPSTLSSSSLTFSVQQDWSYAKISFGSNQYAQPKSGAWHEIGVVYYDESGRISNVQQSNGMRFYVPFDTERVNKGQVSLKWEIYSDAPSWAKYWGLLYTGNQSCSFWTQIVTNACHKRYPEDIYDNQILISLDSLRQYNTDNPDSIIAYDFVKGDRLRILNKPTTSHPHNLVSTGRNIDYYIDVEILDVLDEPEISSSATLPGRWAVIFNVNSDGYRYSDVVSNPDTSLYKNALIEIYRPKPETDRKIFYELGETYPVFELDGRHVHGGKNSNQGSINTTNITSVSISGNIVTLTLNLLSSNPLSSILSTGKLFLLGGAVNNMPSGYYKIVGTGTSSGFHQVIVNFNMQNLGYTGGSVIVFQTPASGQLVNFGDAYYRQRVMKPGENNTVIDASVCIQNVEDPNYSDFIDSKFYSYGRVNAINRSAKRQRFDASVFYTGGLIQNSSVNRMNKIYPGRDFKDFNLKYGLIEVLDSFGDTLIIGQSDKVSRAEVSKSMIFSANGTSTITTSSQVLSDAIPYAGDYGVGGAKNSWSGFGYRRYFFDIQRGTPVRLSLDGLEPINSGVASFFIKKQYDISQSNQPFSIIGSYRHDTGEYVLGFSSLKLVKDEIEYELASSESIGFREGSREEESGWISFYGFEIENFDFNNSSFITWKGGYPWIEAESALHNRLYDIDTNSFIDVVASSEPGKAVKFLSMVCSSKFSPEVPLIKTSMNQSSLIYQTNFVTENGVHSAPFLFDILTPNISFGLYEGNELVGEWIEMRIMVTSQFSNRILFVSTNVTGTVY